MKQKKTMRVWQMIVILVLSVVMLVTMFLPAFRINGDAMVDATEKVLGNTLTSVLGTGLDQQAESIDNAIAEYEQENGVSISKISAFNIMTKSFTKLVVGQQMSDEDKAELEKDSESAEVFKSLQRKYTILRVMLWIVYGVALLVFVLTLLGCLLKMSKYIPLIISAVYGLFATILFGYLRFFLLKGISKSSVFQEMIGNAAGLGAGIGGVTESISSVAGKIITSFYSIAFLIAFIVAILILFSSILFMFIGNGSVEYIENDEDEEENISQMIFNGSEDHVQNQGFDPSNNKTIGGGDNHIFVETSQIPKKEVQKVKQPPMGQVKCTKGIALGMGYALPQNRKVIVGKSMANANLIINNQNISNVHCSIRYNAATNTYLVKDHSMNGTFVSGVRLQKDAVMEFPAGTILSLADGSNEITLG